MSSTRYADESGHFRQSRYASNDAFEGGLLCNLVAKRCQLVLRPKDRALLYWLQRLSHEEGGLDKVTADFIATSPEWIGTEAMHRLKIQPGQALSLKAWEEIKPGFPTAYWNRNDYSAMAQGTLEADFVPTSADELFSYCFKQAAQNLPDMLRVLCLDPEAELESPLITVKLPTREGRQVSSWWSKDLLTGLHACRVKCIETAKCAIAGTTISKQIFEDLDYAAHCHGLVIIEGDQRTGKSTAAKNWCDSHPGQAVYVKLGVGNDNATFFRTVAKALGTASSLTRKPTEMQMKIEDALQERHLVLVCDEAHFLFGQTKEPRSAPSRLDWIRTALVDFGVAVALISTPQFDRSCELYERTLKWNAKQVKGRVKLHRILPTELPEQDLEAVARKMAPHADKASLARLVGFAEASDDYLAGIERLTQRAAFFAFRDGREVANRQDIKRALDEATPRAIAAEPTPVSAKRSWKKATRALPLQRGCKPVSSPLPPESKTKRISLDLSASQEAELEAGERLQFIGAGALA